MLVIAEAKRINGKSESESESESEGLVCLSVYFSMLVVSFFMWSAALDSSGVLLPYPLISLA